MRYVLLIASLVFNSCGTLPEKPEVTNCLFLIEHNRAACLNNVTGEESEVPLTAMDKYVAFSPGDWVKAIDYIRMLEKYRRNHPEIKKLLGSYPSKVRVQKKRN